MEPQLLFTVAESFRLTGLGLLVVPAGAVPTLGHLALHTKLLVRVAAPGQSAQTVVASVEELSRPVVGSDPPTYRDAYGLLLETGAIDSLPAGTKIWAVGEADDPFALLR